jgi:crotonobetainyl-CoA:carnitine CoA-transferase CaiB-like acyl-CoA transferase
MLEKVGLSYEALTEVNPGLLIARIPARLRILG